MHDIMDVIATVRGYLSRKEQKKNKKRARHACRMSSLQFPISSYIIAFGSMCLCWPDNVCPGPYTRHLLNIMFAI